MELKPKRQTFTIFLRFYQCFSLRSESGLKSRFFPPPPLVSSELFSVCCCCCCILLWQLWHHRSHWLPVSMTTVNSVTQWGACKLDRFAKLIHYQCSPLGRKKKILKIKTKHFYWFKTVLYTFHEMGEDFKKKEKKRVQWARKLLLQCSRWRGKWTTLSTWTSLVIYAQHQQLQGRKSVWNATKVLSVWGHWQGECSRCDFAKAGAPRCHPDDCTTTQAVGSHQHLPWGGRHTRWQAHWISNVI